MKTIKELRKISERSEIHPDRLLDLGSESPAFNFQVGVSLERKNSEHGDFVLISAKLEMFPQNDSQADCESEVYLELELRYQAVFEEGQEINTSDKRQDAYDALWPYVYDNMTRIIQQYQMPSMPPLYRLIASNN